MPDKTAAFEAMLQIQKCTKAIRALVSENILLRQALIELSKIDPGCIQSTIAKRTLNEVGIEET
jgi:hypothetical protein